MLQVHAVRVPEGQSVTCRFSLVCSDALCRAMTLHKASPPREQTGAASPDTHSKMRVREMANGVC